MNYELSKQITCDNGNSVFSSPNFGQNCTINQVYMIPVITHQSYNAMEIQ